MLKNDIPHFCYSIRQIKDLIDAIQPEIDRINKRLEEMKSDVHVSTTSVIERFERDLGIVPDISKPLEDRIMAVFNKKNIRATFTEERLNALIQRNYKSNKFRVYWDYPNYEFNILLEDDKQIGMLREALEIAKPAHLHYFLSLLVGSLKLTIRGMAYIISNRVLRCGTFRTGEEPL